MDTRIIDRTISNVRNGKTNSLRILHRPMRASHETAGTDWSVRPSQSKRAREAIMAQSLETLEMLRPHLDHIASQVPGFKWTIDKDGKPVKGVAKYVWVKVQLGKERDRTEWLWRDAHISIAGKKMRVEVIDVAVDDDIIFQEGTRMDGSILVVNARQNPTAFKRAAEYVTALAAEGRHSDRHWKREDYEGKYDLVIRTSEWGFNTNVKNNARKRLQARARAEEAAKLAA